MTATNPWQQRLFFFSLVAVLFTTLFSWFNVNSYCIILLLVSRLIDKPITSLKTAFANPVFLCFLTFCIIGAAGFLYTHNAVSEGKSVSKEATLVAIAFAWCAAGPLDEGRYRKLLDWYYGLLFAASAYCLVIAGFNYRRTGDIGEFFYHSLTRPISQNAVFYSVYVVFGLLFLLSPRGAALASWLSPKGRIALRYFLVIFFLGLIVLLNSKLLLVIALLLLIHAFLRRYSFRKHKRIVLVAGAAIVAGVGILAFTKNPVSYRYKDMKGDLAIVHQRDFSPDLYFNPLQLRVLEWRFASEILQEQHAWLFGVSPGDSQDLLDQKYVQTHMYIGNPADGPHRHIRGYIGYNFHNQYLETLVRSGFLGLAALLVLFVALFAAARRQGTREAVFVVIILAVFFIPEAPLTMQHGVFLFCFFPLLALAGPRPLPVPATGPKLRPTPGPAQTSAHRP
jgi:O-antigen ligase